MKKIILFIFIIIFTYNVFSQNKKIAGGLYIGPGMSWMSSDSKIVEPEGAKLNYSFGAILDINFLDNFAFSTGLAFNNYGGKFRYKYGAPAIIPDEGQATNNITEGTKFIYSLNYLSLPLGFKGKTDEIGYSTFFLKAGISPMINLKGKADIGDLKDQLIGKEIKTFNMCWHIGGGIERTLAGNTKLLVELLYTGIIFDVDKTKVFNNPSKVSTDDPKLRINDISLKIGILF